MNDLRTQLGKALGLPIPKNDAHGGASFTLADGEKYETHYRKCFRKRPYATQTAAEFQVDLMQRKSLPGAEFLVAYHCQACGNFHTGNSSTRRPY